MCASVQSMITETNVPESRRMGFYSRQFSRAAFATCEGRYLHFMDKLCPAYKGAYWEFVELSNGGFYVFPILDGELELEWWSNDFRGTGSAKVAGIIVTMLTLSSYYGLNDPDHFVIKNELLKDFVSQLPDDDKRTIYRAID